MNQVPYITKKDLQQQSKVLRAEMQQMKEELHQEIQNTAQELRKEMQDMKQALRTEMQQQRNELIEAIQMLSQQMDTRFNEVWTILDRLNITMDHMHEDHVALMVLYKNHDHRIEHLEHAISPAA